MKQTHMARNHCVENVRRVHANYVKLKEKIDSMRLSIGLEILPKIPDEDKLKKDYLDLNKNVSSWIPAVSPDLLPRSMASQLLEVGHLKLMTPLIDSRPFRQQPPPMKTCMSCHQQIHRNAPICPLCKAKSRSRHPKKNKRKLEEAN